MRVSCSFVLLAAILVAQSQCAPLNPLSTVNQLAAPVGGALIATPITRDVLTGNILGKRVNVGRFASETPVSDLENQVPVAGLVDHLPVAGVTHLAPHLVNLHLGDTLAGVTHLAKRNPRVGGTSNLGNGALGGSHGLPVLGPSPSLSNLPLMGSHVPSLPVVGSPLGLANGLALIKRDPGFGDLSSLGDGALGGSQVLPMLHSLPSFSKLPLSGSGVPSMPAFASDFTDGFFSPSTGLTNPLSSSD